MNNNASNKSATKYQNLSLPPSEERRKTVKKLLLEVVSGHLDSRIEEVFDMADEADDGKIAWTNIEELRWQICGCLADELAHDLGDYVQELMEAGLCDSVPEQTCADPGEPTS